MSSSNVPQYPAMFDPSQMLNKYSDMNSAKFQMYNYYGTPTDAMGNPINSYKPYVPPAPVPAPSTPGTTLNSTPQQPTFQHATMPDGMPYGQTNLGRGVIGQSWQPQQQAPQQAAAAPAQQDPTQSAGFRYLLALANPNKVVTPGVAPPPRASQPGSINLDSILANMKSAGMAPPQSQTGIVQGTAPSNGFLQTLAALRAGSPGAK